MTDEQWVTNETEYQAIIEALRLLRESNVSVFGSQYHRFRTHPPLLESTVREFEIQHSIILPPDYRGFLVHVGNGGAGPYYGLFKLGEMDDGYDYRQWSEQDDFVGVLSLPFPHVASWNNMTGEPEYDAARENDVEWEEEYERQLELWQEQYWDPSYVNGAIPICHLGCALRQWLVVTGPEAGHIWCDDRTDRGGLYPLQHTSSERVTFMQWYRSWLDQTLQKLRG